MFFIWSVVLWSFHWAFQGGWPTHDHEGVPYPNGSTASQKAGTPLAGGFKLVIWSLKGDLDHFLKAYGLKSYNSNTPGEFCEASRGATVNMIFKYFGTDAVWKFRAFSSTSWKMQCPTLHYIFGLTYLSVLNIEPDELHIIHLGTSQYMYGSVLTELIYRTMPNPPTENMKDVWARVCAFYKEHTTKTQFNNLRFNSFHEFQWLSQAQG